MLPPNIISEIHGKLVDQGTGEPTGLNQAFDELLSAYEKLELAALNILTDIPSVSMLESCDSIVYTVYSSKLRRLESLVTSD